jgi:aspartate beta-hydroxylase
MANAITALRQGDHAKALQILRALQRADPNSLDLRLNMALAYRVAGNFPAAVQLLDEVLAIDPYQFMALLSKAAILERMGQTISSAKTYEAALALAPPDDLTPAALKAPIAHARQVLARRDQDLSDFLETRLVKARADLGAVQTARFDQCLDIFVGRKKVYMPQPLLMHFPGLPVIQFFDRDLFPWLAQLEAASDIIRDEMLALRAQASDQFAPYIAFPPGAPVNQWADLNHSRDWTSFWLWKDGVRQEAACARCPQTAKVIEALPLAHQPDFAPTVVFSSLQAHTHIPPHTGSSNARLLVHLPLDLPGPARFRVGNDERSWQMGQAWVFDDTIEHEAWNDADRVRTILIFDIWNPCLTLEERELVSVMMAAKNEFMAG